MGYEDWLADNWPPYKKQLENKKLENKVKYKLTFEEKLDIEMKRVLEVRDNMTDQIMQFRLDEIDKALLNSLTPKQLLQNELVRELVEVYQRLLFHFPPVYVKGVEQEYYRAKLLIKKFEGKK